MNNQLILKSQLSADVCSPRKPGKIVGQSLLSDNTTRSCDPNSFDLIIFWQIRPISCPASLDMYLLASNAQFLPSFAGLQLETEISALKKVTSEIKKPVTCIVVFEG